MEKVTEEAHLINSCGATTGQQLHLANTVMHPAIRYSMSIVPYSHLGQDPRPPLRPHELREKGEWFEPQGEHAAHDETERGIWGRR
jgi:hypothetical protein